MNPRDKFAIGDRVRPTEAAREHFCERSFAELGLATVVGFSDTYPHTIAVLRDGRKNRQLYAAKFWERIETSATTSTLQHVPCDICGSLTHSQASHHHAEMARQRRERLAAAKLCIDCKEPASPGLKRCEACLIKDSARNSRRAP